jgi:hypothetical protein
MGIIYKPKNPNNKERRFAPDEESKLNPTWKHLRLKREWRDNWEIFKEYEARA